MADGGWTAVGVIAAVVTLLVTGFIAWLTLHYMVVPAKESRLLSLAARRSEAGEQLGKRLWSEKYAGVLAGGLAWMEHSYGPKQGRYALALSGVLALVYAWAFFCLMWAFGASDGTVLGQELLKPLGQVVRLPMGLVLAVLPPGLFLFFRWWTPRLERWQATLEERWIDRPRRKWMLRAGMGLACGLLILAADYLSDGEISSAFAIAIAGAGAGAGAAQSRGSGRLSIPQMVWLGLICLIFLVVGLIYDGADARTITFVAFFGVLPLWASRCLGEHLQGVVARSRLRWLVPAIVGHVALDVVAAVGLLGLLAGFLAFTMQAITNLRGLGFDVAGEIVRAAGDPLGHGLWFGAMLFSTLIPTLLHFVMLAGSPLMFTGPDRAVREAWAGRMVRADFDKDQEADQALAIAVAKWQTYGQGLFAVGGGLVLVGLIVAVLYYAAAAVGLSPADGIARVARWGVALANGF